MSRTRVLIIQRILPPYRIGFFQALSRSAKLEVSIACGEAAPDSSLESVLDVPGIRVERIANRYVGKGERLIVQRGVLPLVRSGKFDVLIAELNPRVVTNLLVYQYAKRWRIPIIWWGHGIRPSGRFQKLYMSLSNGASANIFYSQAGADGLVAQGLPAEKAFVAWNSIDTAEINPLVVPYEPETRNGILCIGRLIPEKKPELLLRAFAQATAEHGLNANLILVGEGSERPLLERLAAETGVSDRVVFVGSAYGQTELAPHFNRSRLSVSPGYIGLSAIHSMAYGLPMLVADDEPHSPEIAAIKDGINACFFAANDVKDCAHAMKQMYCDGAALSRMSQAARQTVREQFSMDAMVNAFEQAIQFARKEN
jgi:glycosyltransferase involved in cell wall biosynthesis